MKPKYVVPSLLAAGLIGAGASQANLPEVDNLLDTSSENSLFQIFRTHDTLEIAAHGSHRSHGSHGSHGSHRSSAGGAAPRAPASPLYTPPTSRNTPSTPPSSVLPSSPSVPQGTQNLRGVTQTVIQVQQALRQLGYYNGALDGIIGPASRSALARFQSDYGMTVTGTITLEVLRGLSISQ